MQDETNRKAVAKEITRVSRYFLEMAVENYRCLTFCTDYLATQGAPKSQEFLAQSSGMLEWLGSIHNFSKSIKKHLQEGRLALMNFLGEKQGYAQLSELQTKRIDKKSVLLSQLDEMLQAVFELRTQAKAEAPSNPVVEKRLSVQDTFVSKIDPDFITIQQEPLDIVHLKDERYLIGSYDGSLMLKDVRSPKRDQTFRQHLNNRATWIRSIIRDNENKVWVATSNELTVYDKSFKIVMQTRSYNPSVKFYGHFKILWTDKKGQYIFWWCDRDAIKVFHSRTLKLMSKIKGLIKNIEERPNHYTFLDGSYKKMFIITNNEPLPNKYYVVDVLRRSVQRGEYAFPQDDKTLKFSYLCMAYNCPSTCVVTTGVCARYASPTKNVIQRAKDNEMSHLTVYKLTKDNQLDFVDQYFNMDLKHINNSAIVFHKPHHTRVLAVQTNDILVMDLVNQKLQMLFVIKDINRGEVVHQLIRLKNSFLFVGNYGQIFKVDFVEAFFQAYRRDEAGKSRPVHPDFSKKEMSHGGGAFHLMGGFANKPSSHGSYGEQVSPNPTSPGPIGSLKDKEKKAPPSQKTAVERTFAAPTPAGFSLDKYEKPIGGEQHYMENTPKSQLYEPSTKSVGRQYQAWGSPHEVSRGDASRRTDARAPDQTETRGNGPRRFERSFGMPGKQ